MKKILVLITCFFITFTAVKAEDINLYLFYGEGCPHCAAEKVYLDELQVEYPDLVINQYEVWHNKDNAELLDIVAETYGKTITGVPVTIIGDKILVGYDDFMNPTIENKVSSYLEEECPDIVGEIIETKDVVDIDEYITNMDEDTKVDIPVLGNIDAKKASLALVATVLGFVDGFNPCAMWVLIFLISFLITTNNRKKMWLLGTIFIFASAFIYMFFMMSWLQISIKLTSVTIIRNIIALVALIAGIINLKSYIKSRKEVDGCEVVDSTKRKKLINRIKKYVLEKNIFIAIIGIIALAFSVNLIELACSLGLPVLFTSILSMNELSPFMYSLYIFIYIFFFLIDDLIIFIIAMITFKVTGISNKYTKYSHLIGGLIMLIVGLLLIFKPAWIMFNF